MKLAAILIDPYEFFQTFSKNKILERHTAVYNHHKYYKFNFY